jgi:DNA-binding NarL/FixJ family response regulator
VTAIRVLLVDDEILFREGTRAALEADRGLRVVGAVGSDPGALERRLGLCPDVAVVDILLSQRDGVEAVRILRQRCPSTAVLVLTTTVSYALFRQAAAAGAAGYVLKDIAPANLCRAVRAVHQGTTMLNPDLATIMLREVAGAAALGAAHHQYGLTERELEVLINVARGLSDREIAWTLSVSEFTVKSHLRTVYHRLKLRNRAHAVAFVIEKGLVRL